MLAKIAEGIPVEGMESLAPALLDRLVPLTDYLPADAAVAVLSPERVATRAAQPRRDEPRVPRRRLERRDRRRRGADRPRRGRLPHASRGAARPQPDRRTLVDVQPLRRRSDAEPSVDCRARGRHASGAELRRPAPRAPSTTSRAPAARRLDGRGRRPRARSRRARAPTCSPSASVAARAVDEVPADPEPGVAYLLQARSSAASSCPTRSSRVLTEAEFYGRTAGIDSRQVKKLASRRKNVVDPLQLKAGDYVVHQTHGIGRFVELVQREVARAAHPRGPLGTTVTEAKVVREYLVLEYAPSQARATRATSSTCRPTSSTCSPATSAARRPRSRKMGGSDWAAAKGRARKAVRDIAVELVKLYSRAHGVRRATRSGPTPRGSASSRRRSRSPRRPTSCRPSTR